MYHAPGESTVNAFLPYLPLMTVFGIPSERKHDVALTDARIFFSLVTLLGRRRCTLALPGRRSPQDARPASHRHLPHRGPSSGDWRRRHARRGLPVACHGVGAAEAAVRLGRRPGDRVRHEVHSVAAGRVGALRGAQSKRGTAPSPHVPRDAGRRRSGRGAVRAARTVGILRQCDFVPARLVGSQVTRGQPPSRAISS